MTTATDTPAGTPPVSRSPLRLAASYLWVIGPLKAVCDQHGYALTLHGSMLHDLDAVCCPWKDVVSPPHVLAAAVVETFGGYIAEGDLADTPRRKPHGRLSWPIQLCPGYYIDLSVMPVGGSPNRVDFHSTSPQSLHTDPHYHSHP